ncbi:MAG: prenyltransferase/squalene oxidase repeat-containing protein, partial [Candidatus Lutacidiplasmatales archaeon]
MALDPVLRWLLEPSQPGVRYRSLTGILGRPEGDPDVVATRKQVPALGWAAEILDERDPAGWWVDGASFYTPKYRSTVWRLLVLADLGVTRDDPAVRASCELWFARDQKADGGFGVGGSKAGHECLTGNAARALIEFGYGEDPRVRRAMEWLVDAADPKGGWSCYGSGRLLDTWEPLTAFAVYPRSLWTPAMAECVSKGAEYFLSRELYQQGDRYEPWFRTHYPPHYYYDLLVGLDALTSLGFGADPRLDFALAWLRDRRRKDGRWNLDALHPDVAGGIAEWLEAHPKRRPTPWGLETPGKPSKMVTLAARRVLRRVELARSGPITARAAPRETPRAASRG